MDSSARDRELGCLFTPGMTEEQMAAEREICRLVVKLDEMRAQGMTGELLQMRIDHLLTVRGPRTVSGGGGITLDGFQGRIPE